MPEINVVIPCFNYGRFLDQAVESVLAQSFRDFDVLVVDDGSTDPATRELLDGYERPETTVLRTANRGAGAARNAGIRASGGEYVVCLDADDRLHPRYLEKTRAVLEADGGGRLGFVTTWLRRFGAEDVAVRDGAYSPAALASACTVHSASLFRRRAWEKVGGYRESLPGWEDWNLWLNIAGAGYRWEVVPEELFYYRKHGKTRSARAFEKRPELFEQVLRDNKKLYREHLQEILMLSFRKLVELEGVWREKDLALADNRTLARQLAEEQDSRREALEEHRRLEASFRQLSSSLGEVQADRESIVERHGQLEARFRDLSSSLEAEQAGREQTVAEYCRLEGAYRDQSSDRERAAEAYRQLETYLEDERASRRETEREYRRLEAYCRSLESALDRKDRELSPSV